MADSVSITRMVETDQYLLRIVLDRINTDTLDTIIDRVPALVADEYLRDHMQEIMGKINVNEVVTLIAAAVAQRVAEAYKPNEEQK